jgi:hypothetical protein
MRKKTGPEELAGFAELAELAAMAMFMLLMASFQGTEIRDQRSVEFRSADYFHCPPMDGNYLQKGMANLDSLLCAG